MSDQATIDSLMESAAETDMVKQTLDNALEWLNSGGEFVACDKIEKIIDGD